MARREAFRVVVAFGLPLLIGLVLPLASMGAEELEVRAKWTAYTKWPFDAAEAKRRQAETAKALGVKVEQDFQVGKGVKIRMVLIPAGTFTMGSTEASIKALAATPPDEKPAHKVTISKAFWMGKHEVTVGQFRRFVEAKGYQTDAEKGRRSKRRLVKGAYVDVKGNLVMRRTEDASWRNPYFKQTDEHPVVCVSWGDARAFADWLNVADEARPAGASYRLPTEAEWEYACRAGTATLYQWGDDLNRGEGWCNGLGPATRKTFRRFSGLKWDDGFVYTAPVGSLRANAFGLHDMHGNVWEWCQDWKGAYSEGHQSDAAGPATGRVRVIRGGSWHTPLCDLRSAAWGGNHPSALIWSTHGFRLVLAPGPR